MDKTWMFVDRTTSKYDDGVDSFIRFAIVNSDDSNVIRCPCTKCRNAKLLHPNVVKDHLFVNGVLESYTTWFWHGENISSVPIEEKIESDFEVGDGLNTVEMVDAVYRDYETKPDGFVKLLSDAEKPLYSGCTTFNVLSTLVRLYNLKTKHGWTENSFSELLSLIGDILPKENSLPTSIYEAKKTLSTLGMQYTKIHACPNDCILYRKEYENSVVCPKCGLSRWKVMKNHKVKEGVPANVLWYFPPIPRFKRMFGTKEIAKDLTWHDNKRQIDSYMRHPADSPAWKVVDHKWPDFGSELRNLRLALSADGVNPFSNYSTQYSRWPVILATYNLPPWLVMKRKFMMLTLLISGPKQPGNDIDVYLAPLIDDLKELWEVGVDVYDAYKKEVFNLKAIFLWTINDFPAYGNLSGCTVKGYKACPICGDNTVSQRLECSKKISYCGHRKYLPRGHKFRKQKKTFDGNEENGLPPNPLSGEEVFEKVSGIHNEWGKSKKRKATRNNSDSTLSWKKKSIFFNLEYWKHLYVRHCLDVMHIEKNVCESLIGTILGIPGKSKDGLSTQEDLEVMGIRDELQPQKEGEKTYLPAACYNMSRAEKKKFYTTLFELKVPEGYSSNFRNRVSMDELKLNGLKSHDCHTLIQQLLPIAIRGMLPKKVRYAITKLCLFFNALCNKVLDVNTLDGIQEELVTTLCLLEMYLYEVNYTFLIYIWGQELVNTLVGDKMVPWTLELLKKHAETKMDCDKSIQGHLPEELFGERRTAFIFEDDIVKFCCMKQIGQTCIVLYMSYLYLELKKKNWGQMYGFIDPNRFFYNVGKPQARADTLANRMKDAIEDQIFLAPYNANSHWLLVAIDPFNNSAYFMDSMGRKAPNDVKDAVKLGLRLWNTERKVHSGTFKFQVVKAPQQPGGVECGYYVMHFMKDIVEKHILSTSEKAFDTKTYSQEEIDELRNEWAVYVGSFL